MPLGRSPKWLVSIGLGRHQGRRDIGRAAAALARESSATRSAARSLKGEPTDTQTAPSHLILISHPPHRPRHPESPALNSHHGQRLCTCSRARRSLSRPALAFSSTRRMTDAPCRTQEPASALGRLRIFAPTAGVKVSPFFLGGGVRLSGLVLVDVFRTAHWMLIARQPLPRTEHRHGVGPRHRHGQAEVVRGALPSTSSHAARWRR